VETQQRRTYPKQVYVDDTRCTGEVQAHATALQTSYHDLDVLLLFEIPDRFRSGLVAHLSMIGTVAPASRLTDTADDLDPEMVSI